MDFPVSAVLGKQRDYGGRKCLHEALEKVPEKQRENVGQYKRCNCPKWLRWGKDVKKSAKTRSWEVATKKAHKLQADLDLEALGIEAPKKPDHITIEAAINLYLDDMAQRGIKDPSKARRMLGRLREYANAKDVILLKALLCC